MKRRAWVSVGLAVGSPVFAAAITFGLILVGAIKAWPPAVAFMFVNAVLAAVGSAVGAFKASDTGKATRTALAFGYAAFGLAAYWVALVAMVAVSAFLHT